MPRRDLRQYYVFYRVASRQRRRYRPTSVFDGPALVLRASDQDHGELDRDLGWSPYLRSRPSVVDVPGTHHTMIFRPHVTSVGAELQRAFDSAS
jgi:thioesterase domain-containing protein